MSAADIPTTALSIMKKKRNNSRTVGTTSRHILETKDNGDGTATTSIAKRAMPSKTMSVTNVNTMPEDRFAFRGKVYVDEDKFADEGEKRYKVDAYRKTHPEELDRMNRENYENNKVTKYEFNRHPDNSNLNYDMRINLKNRPKKQKVAHKSWFSDDMNVLDAKYTEIVDSITAKTVPVRDARSLKIAKKDIQKSKPESIAAISESKQETKENLKRRPTKQVSAAEAFDYLIDTFKGQSSKPTSEAQTAQKKRHSLKSNIMRGIKDVNEVCEEIGKNPNIQRIKQQQETDIRAIKSANRHIKGDIGATANKHYIHAGSLVTQKSNRPNTNVVPTTTQKVYPQVIHRKGGDIIRYFTANGLEVSAFKARKILNGTPLPLPKVPIVPTVSTIGNTVEKQVVPTAAPATQYGNTGNPVNVAKKQRNPLGNTRKEGNPIGEITRATHPSGLVRRAKNPVGVIHGAVQSAYKPTGAVNTATTATNVLKNPTGFVQRNPVVNSSAVTPSRLLYRYAGA